MKLKLRITYLLATLMLAAAPLSAQQGIALVLRNGTTNPATCQPAALNVFLNRTPGSVTPVFCTAANTWTAPMMAASGTTTTTWVNSAAGDWNPTVNNTYSLGNNLVNPKDINLTRNLSFFNGAATTLAPFLTNDGTNGIVWKAYTAAPTALTATIAAGAGVTAGTHSYKVTFITAGGETDAGAVSNTVTTAAGNLQVNLTGIPLGNQFVTGRNVYRCAIGNEAVGPWKLIAASPVIANNTATTLSDNTADAALTTTIPTTNTAIDTRWTFANSGNATQAQGSFTPGSGGIIFNGSNLLADAANVLALRNGVNAQTFNLYNTFTDASNYERLTLRWSSSVVGIFADSLGTGVARQLQIGTLNATDLLLATGGSTRWAIDAATGQFKGAAAAQGKLTAGTMTATNTAELRTVTHRYDWTNAMVTALGAVPAGDITVATFPAKTNVDDVKVVIDTPDTSTNALTVACGTVAAGYIDYVVASDAKAAANTVYGDATAERGTNMVIVGGHLASYTGTTALNCHFIKTTTNLSTVLGSTGHVIITTRLLP